MNLDIHIDGGSRGNPGPAAVGVVVRELESGKLIHEAGYYLGKTTNNVAEYQGMVRALQLAERLEAQEVRVVSDSQLMVRQITGQYKVKSAKLAPLFERVQLLLLKFDTWRIVHVKREQNKRADELVNLALDKKRDVLVTGEARGGDTPPDDAPASQAPTTWVTVTLTRDPGGKCPAGCEAGEPYELGPATPEGLCAYAAKAALDHVLGASRNGGRAIKCPQCNVPLDLDSPE